jgi:hypothetical protein
MLGTNIVAETAQTFPVGAVIMPKFKYNRLPKVMLKLQLLHRLRRSVEFY